MDIGAWLRIIGLSEYEAVFRENAIDGEVLPDLTADDLREIGVLSVGHRRKILSAISRLKQQPGEPGAEHSDILTASRFTWRASLRRRPVR